MTGVFPFRESKCKKTNNCVMVCHFIACHCKSVLGKLANVIFVHINEFELTWCFVVQVFL